MKNILLIPLACARLTLAAGAACMTAQLASKRAGKRLPGHRRVPDEGPGSRNRTGSAGEVMKAKRWLRTAAAGVLLLVASLPLMVSAALPGTYSGGSVTINVDSDGEVSSVSVQGRGIGGHYFSGSEIKGSFYGSWHDVVGNPSGNNYTIRDCSFSASWNGDGFSGDYSWSYEQRAPGGWYDSDRGSDDFTTNYPVLRFADDSTRTVSAAGDTIVLDVTESKVSSWSATTTESSWLHPTVVNGDVSLIVDPNTSTSARTGYVRLYSGNVQADSVMISQRAVATPAFTPDGSAQPGSSVSVTVACATAGATIRYTTNGSEPTVASPIVASGGTVTVPIPGTLKATAWASGVADPSFTKSASYTVAPNVNTPAFTPESSAHPSSSVSVTVTCVTAGATIRYTTDNSEPTAASTAVASGGTVSVPIPGTLKAKAWKSGLNPSATKSARYTAPPMPSVTTVDAIRNTPTTATLYGTVNPNGAPTTAQFEYGLTTAYGSVVSVTLSPANGTTVQTVSASISGLQAGQIYHYRLTATNYSGTRLGADRTFVADVLPYTCTIANGAITITKYTGSGGAVNIPGTMMGLPVTSIGSYAFSDCTGLKAVTIPNSVTSIGYDAFSGCTGLTAVTIPNGVTSIEYSAFSGCTGLTAVTIPQSVTSIRSSAFYHCTGLASANFTGNAPTMGSSVFAGTASGFTVYYTSGSMGFTSPTWNGYLAMSVRAAPVVTTTPASGIASSSATLKGKVNPNGAAATARFEYGLTTAYGSTASVTLSPANGNTLQSVSAKISGLQAGRTYHYRLTATNSGGTGTGADRTLATIPLVPQIAVQQPAGSGLKNGGARSFGAVALRSTVTKTFTIKNTGTANLTKLSVARSGTNAADFIVKAPLKTTLAPGAKTTFKVIFKPTAKGDRKALLRIGSNDRKNDPFEIVLTGKGSSPAKSAVVKSARLPSWRDLAAPGDKNRSHQTVGAATLADGRKYLTLTVRKPPGGLLLGQSVEVSPNLIDWYSGGRHTTILIDDAVLLKVRDNVPLTPGTKRYIRMKTH